MLIEERAWWFDYSLHDVPRGVLGDFGKGVSADDCLELEQELEAFSQLVQQVGMEQRYQSLIDDCRYHFHHYRHYLLNPNPFAGYWDYLDKHG
ncbi:MAG: hypothetical protein M3220_09385 [Chloroflexota bacterium]|nr:hypothetical protein [Chloroflexota bacterium]